jgi:hypothetical protein
MRGARRPERPRSRADQAVAEAGVDTGRRHPSSRCAVVERSSSLDEGPLKGLSARHHPRVRRIQSPATAVDCQSVSFDWRDSRQRRLDVGGLKRSVVALPLRRTRAARATRRPDFSAGCVRAQRAVSIVYLTRSLQPCHARAMFGIADSSHVTEKNIFCQDLVEPAPCVRQMINCKLLYQPSLEQSNPRLLANR